MCAHICDLYTHTTDIRGRRVPIWEGEGRAVKTRLDQTKDKQIGYLSIPSLVHGIKSIGKEWLA